jgi:hypothetical protein
MVYITARTEQVHTAFLISSYFLERYSIKYTKCICKYITIEPITVVLGVSFITVLTAGTFVSLVRVPSQPQFRFLRFCCVVVDIL